MKPRIHRTKNAQGVEARCIGPGQYLADIKGETYSITRTRKVWWIDSYNEDGTHKLNKGPFKSMDEAVRWILDNLTGTSTGAAPGA